MSNDGPDVYFRPGRSFYIFTALLLQLGSGILPDIFGSHTSEAGHTGNAMVFRNPPWTVSSGNLAARVHAVLLFMNDTVKRTAFLHNAISLSDIYNHEEGAERKKIS